MGSLSSCSASSQELLIENKRRKVKQEEKRKEMTETERVLSASALFGLCCCKGPLEMQWTFTDSSPKQEDT